MKEPIHIIIDAIPPDGMSFVVSIVSGIVVPFLLILITWYITRTSRIQAIKHAEQIHLSDKKLLFSDNAHMAIDNLYKKVQTLRHNNIQRKKYDEWSEKVTENNKEIMSRSTSEAKQMQQELLRWHLDKILQLEIQHGEALIEVKSAQSRVQHILTEDHTAATDEIIHNICKASKESGGITEELGEKFTSEINNLMKQVEDNPEQWVKP